MEHITAEEYIAKCPIDAQKQLRLMRAYIQKAAPGATERTDYFGIPGYSYEGYDYDGMFAWFSYKQPYVRIHVRPPVIQDNDTELSSYKRTKSIVSFPLDEELPKDLIMKLVVASIRVMKDRKLRT